MPTFEELINWHAADWTELRLIWQALIGLGDDPEEVPVTPRFRGESINESQAGYVFQTWVIEAFRLNHVEIEPPFKIPREPGINEQALAEVDGLATLDHRHFLIESKFQQVDFDPIARLHLLSEQRPIGTMGLLFAAGGFTAPALDSAHILRPIRVLLFTLDDLNYIAAQGDIALGVRVKWKQAVKFGRPNLPIDQQE